METFTTPSENELETYFTLLKEMRTELTFGQFLSIYEEAKKESYRIVGLKKDDVLVGLLGYRIITDYVHGRHLYIDDLVTTEKMRSQGLGAKLLKKAEELAKEEKCPSLRLCTGIQNEAGKKFYETNGWNLRAVAFKKKLT